MDQMIHLRFPNDIDAPSSEKDSNGNTLFVATDKKRYFKILIKELPTGYDYIVKKASELVEVASNITTESIQNVATSAVDKIDKGVDSIKNNGVTAVIDGGTTVLNTATSVLKPKSEDDTSITIGAIGLPLPNELNESLSHNWEKQTSIAADIGGKLLGFDFAGISAAKALSQMSNNVVRKPTIDPGYFQDYNGTEPRTFSFSWDLIPRNRDEAIQIREIVVHLKKYTLPSKTNIGVVMNSPHHFDIEFGNDIFDTMINMKDLVCTQMEVSYSADGFMQMTEDGMPKHIRLSLSFSERRSLYAEDFDYKDIEE